MICSNVFAVFNFYSDIKFPWETNDISEISESFFFFFLGSRCSQETNDNPRISFVKSLGHLSLSLFFSHQMYLKN